MKRAAALLAAVLAAGAVLWTSRDRVPSKVPLASVRDRSSDEPDTVAPVIAIEMGADPVRIPQASAAEPAEAPPTPDVPSRLSAELPAGLEMTGNVRLEDGTPVPHFKLVAEPPSLGETQGAAPFGICKTDLDGSFRMLLQPGVRTDVVLRHDCPAYFAPLHVTRRGGDSGGFDCTLRAAAVLVHFLDENPVDLQIKAEVEGGVQSFGAYPPRGTTLETQRRIFFFPTAGTLRLFVADRDARRSAENSGLPLHLGKLAPELQVQLSDLSHTGRLRVSVRTPEGTPLTDFGVLMRRKEPPMFTRGLPNSEQDSIVLDQLLPGLWRVTIDRPAGAMPTFVRDAGVPSREVNIPIDGLAEVVFEFAAAGRLLLEFDLSPERSDPLRLFVRPAGFADRGWKSGTMESYSGTSTTFVGAVSESGSWYSWPLVEGEYEIELRMVGEASAVWGDRAHVVSGGVSTLRVKL